MTVQTFPREDIQLDARCQARAKIDNDAVDDYAAAYERGDELPPIDVFLVAGKPYNVNGFHRFTAQLKIGVSFVRANVVGSGTIDEAIWHASRANATNGLRRTNEDKRRAARLALESKVGSEQSSRVVAEWIGVHHEMVSKVRSEVEAARRPGLADSASSIQEPPKKLVGKDGKARAATKPKRAAAPTPVVPKGEPKAEPARAEALAQLDAVIAIATKAKAAFR